MEQIKAIYIHIPFCNTICSYCDFCKMFYNKNLVDSYLKEIESIINILTKIIKTSSENL